MLRLARLIPLALLALTLSACDPVGEPLPLLPGGCALPAPTGIRWGAPCPTEIVDWTTVNPGGHCVYSDPCGNQWQVGGCYIGAVLCDGNAAASDRFTPSVQSPI